MGKAQLVQKTVKTEKKFSYSLGGVNLSFTLSLENSSELREFHSCLVQALKDVEAEIAGMKN